MSAKPIPRDPEIRDHKRRLLAAITARLDDLYEPPRVQWRLGSLVSSVVDAGF